MNIEKYDEKNLEYEVSEFFKNGEFKLGRVGNKERWYKSEIGNDEYDGDSLCAKVGDSKYKIIDGINISDVGVFNVYHDTFKEIIVDGHEGYMITYAKIRELAGPQGRTTDRIITLNMLIYDSEKKSFTKKEIDYYRLNEFLTMPLLPQVYLDEKDKTLVVSARIVEPYSMSFTDNPREDLRNYSRDLKDYNISFKERKD